MGKQKKNYLYFGMCNHKEGGIEFQYRFSANAWCDVIDGPFIAPLIAEGSLQTQPTQRFCNTSCQSWENVPLRARSRTYLQRDGASPRVSARETHTSITTYMNGVLAVTFRSRSGHRDDPNSTTLTFKLLFCILSYGPCIMFRNPS
jgi:hypothetical protein